MAFLVLGCIALVLFWNWDWFIPIVEAQASAATGRTVTIRHLHVGLGRVVTVSTTDIDVGSPAGFDAPLLHAKQLVVGIELLPLLHGLHIVIPSITLDEPAVNLLAHPDGQNDWTLAGSRSNSKPAAPGKSPSLGVIIIRDGRVHVADPRLKAIFDINVHTSGTPDPAARPLPADRGRIIADAKGTYAGQPITGHFSGGAILSLRSQSTPYPIDLDVHNGPTSVSLHGTIEQPLVFGGARVALVFQGPDMSLLFPLTGVPIPQTPPYKLSGSLNYRRDRIEFDNFKGTLGHSDLEGTITGSAVARPPDITADLHSNSVDLADLSGFIGGKPGKGSGAAADRTPGSRAPAATATAGNVLPDTPIDLPKLNAANIHLKYNGTHILGKHVPLDNIVVLLEVIDGAINLHKLDFAVGSGSIASHGSIRPGAGEPAKPGSGGMAATYQVDFRDIDLSRVLRATGAFHGDGIITGRAAIDTTGNSIASMLGRGNGGLTLVLTGAGNVSALLSDIAGLEFGNAVLSAIGLPDQTAIQCFVADLPLHQGIIDTKTLLLQTQEARTVGTGTIDLRSQTLDYTLTTRSTHFSVGSLPGPVNITGKLGSPSIRPGTEVIARAGAATGLGILLAPLAVLPTIQLGVGATDACRKALSDVRSTPAVPVTPEAAKPAVRQSKPHRKPHDRSKHPQPGGR